MARFFKPLKEARHEAALFRRRALAGFAIIVACLAALAVRFGVLEIRQHAEFSARSEANRVLTRPLAQVGTFGPDADVLGLLLLVATKLPARPRVTLTRTAARSLPAGWSQAHAADWDLRWLTCPPPVQRGESDAACRSRAPFLSRSTSRSSSSVTSAV